MNDAPFKATAPLTEETRGKINGNIFKRMKPSAFFLNVGRGPVADEDALAEALRNQTIGGAYLDVFGTEPLPKELL